MAYELDFIGVNHETKDADAIGIRWEKNDGNYVVGVYDGGLQIYGEKLKCHIDEFYFNDFEDDDKIIDFVICSHSDQDHASGIKEVLETYKVKKLYMNRPWIYVDDIFDKVNDGRITKESLKRRIKEKYSYIADLEYIAIEKDVPIYEAFQGIKISDKLTVLSPTKDFYLELLVESDKTPLEENKTVISTLKEDLQKILDELLETWKEETLREDVKTTAENEMSVVILGQMDEENFLLTGDAGLRALNSALEYAESIHMPIKDNVSFYQIPHHGGRHNVSTSLLNRMVGEIVDEGQICDKIAFVSAAKNSDHPLQMVVNAFVRRGVKIYKTNGNIIHHHVNMPSRDSWTSIKHLEFNTEVEEWDSNK